MLSNYIPEITICGFNLHSKGAYLFKIPLTIEHKYKMPHQFAADYLSVIVCNNIHSNSSYLQAIRATFASTTKSYLQILSDMEIFSAPNYFVSEKAAEDIAAMLFHTTKLQKLYLGGNNLQTSGAIKIARSLLFQV